MGDEYDTVRVRIGRCEADQFVLPWTPENEQLTLFDAEDPMRDDDGSDGVPGGEVPEPELLNVAAPAQDFPTAEQARQIFALLGFALEEIDDGDHDNAAAVAPGDADAYLAGALHALSSMWVVNAVSDNDRMNAFNAGFIDANGRQIHGILAVQAVITRWIADQAMAVNDIDEDMLIPLTVASAAAEVACWGMVTGGEIAKGGRREALRIQAAWRMMQRKLSALSDRTVMAKQWAAMRTESERESDD